MRLPRLHAAEWVACGVAGFLLLAEYLRIYFSLPLYDDAFYVTSGLMNAMGGKSFHNELFIQQIASLLLEPVLAAYYYIFGKFAIMLFARHLFILCLVGSAFVTYFYARIKTDFIPALAAGLVTLTGASFGYQVLGYNAIGVLAFGCFAIFSIRSIEEQSTRFALWSGIFAFIAGSAYPTMAAGVVLIWTLITVSRIHLKKPFFKYLVISNATAAGLLAVYVTSLILRFSWPAMVLSYRFTTAHAVELGSFWGKLGYAWFLATSFLPWAWFIFPLTLIWLALWWKFGWNWMMVLIPCGIIMAIPLKARPEQGTWAQALMLFAGLLGIPFVVRACRTDFAKYWGVIVLWAASLLTAPVICWTSGMTYYSMHYSALYGLVALYILSTTKTVSRWVAVLTLGIPLLFVQQLYEWSWFNPGHENIENLTEVIDWGAYAGMITYPEEYAFMRQIQDEVDRASTGARSILFYDDFPAGYLMTDLVPATPEMIMHGMDQSSNLRPFFRQYFSLPQNRPDVIVRFSRLLLHQGFWELDPKKYLPAVDPFWNYLPEETGEYIKVAQHENFAVFKRKSLPTK